MIQLVIRSNCKFELTHTHTHSVALPSRGGQIPPAHDALHEEERSLSTFKWLRIVLYHITLIQLSLLLVVLIVTSTTIISIILLISLLSVSIIISIISNYIHGGPDSPARGALQEEDEQDPVVGPGHHHKGLHINIYIYI